MQIASAFTRENPSDDNSKVTRRYIIVTTTLKVEEVMSIAKEIDPYLSNVLKIDGGESSTTVRISVFKAQRVPKFARFLYELMNSEDGS